MKAIAIIDEMPKDCDECPFVNENRDCILLNEDAFPNDWVEDAPYYSLKEKGDCPLKPLPQEGTEFDVIDTKTGKYADLQKIALKEEWAKGLVYCDMEGFAIEQDGMLVLLDECGNCAYPPEGRFKLIWNIGESE